MSLNLLLTLLSGILLIPGIDYPLLGSEMEVNFVEVSEHVSSSNILQIFNIGITLQEGLPFGVLELFVVGFFFLP